MTAIVDQVVDETAAAVRGTVPAQRISTAVVLGARNLGGAIADWFIRDGVRVASVARTHEDLERLRELGALPLRADAADAGQLGTALCAAAERLGPVDLIVNAVSVARPQADRVRFGGGPLMSTSPEDLEEWTVPVIRQAYVALTTGCRALRDRGGTFVQVVGAPARRAAPGRGLLAAGAAGVRAITHAAAQELREEGVQVALLIVDGIIESPKTERMAAGMPRSALVHPRDVAEAVRFLAAQTSRGLTHELVITPSASPWVP